MPKRLLRLKKRFAVLFVSVLSGVAYLALDSYEQEAELIQSPKLGNEEADYYGEGIFYKHFNETGKLQQVLNSQTTEHYPEAQISEFTAPKVQATNKDNKTWQIEALTGVMKDKDNLVTFQHQVRIQPLNPKDGQQLLITTEQLQYHTKEQVATSDLPVKITGDNLTITSIGMSFQVSEEILTLKQQVKTHYAPPTQP